MSEVATHAQRAAAHAGAALSEGAHKATTPAATPEGSRSEAAAMAREGEAVAEAMPRLMRRVYQRGWYKDAPLATAALYALGALGPLAMLAAMMYGLRFTRAPHWTAHFRDIWKVTIGSPLPWSTLAVVDSVLGILFINAWIVFRETNVAVAAAWCAGNLTLGTMTGCMYILKALVDARGDWTRFWLGGRAKSLSTTKKAD